jgi:hypothetical protein
MSSDLGNVTNASIRDCLGTMARNAGLLVVHGTKAESVKTSVAVSHLINGVQQTDFAISAEIAMGSVSVLNGKTGEVGAAGSNTTYAARATGDADQTLVMILACKGATAYIVEASVDVAAAQDDADYELSCPSGYAPFGLIKLVRTAADTSTFKWGSTTAAVGDLNATGRTATYFDISVCPPTVASIVKT